MLILHCSSQPPPMLYYQSRLHTEYWFVACCFFSLKWYTCVFFFSHFEKKIKLCGVNFRRMFSSQSDSHNKHTRLTVLSQTPAQFACPHIWRIKLCFFFVFFSGDILLTHCWRHTQPVQFLAWDFWSWVVVGHFCLLGSVAMCVDFVTVHYFHASLFSFS